MSNKKLYAELQEMVSTVEAQIEACQAFADKHGLIFGIGIGDSIQSYVADVPFDELKQDDDVYDTICDHKEYTERFFDSNYNNFIRGSWVSSSTWC